MTKTHIPDRPTVVWPAIYTDTHGSIPISIASDGGRLRTSIEGVAFEGRSPEVLSPTDRNAADGVGRFAFDGTTLWNCKIHIEMSLVVCMGSVERSGVLHTTWDLGFTTSRPDVVGQTWPEFCVDDLRIAAQSGDFETALPQIERGLPDAGWFKTCLRCQWGAYSPGGTDSFGTMLCFRRLKEAYLGLTGKLEFFQLEADAEGAQETYLCPEFARRTMEPIEPKSWLPRLRK